MTNKLIFIFLNFFILSSCDYYDVSLQIINNSNKVICFDYDIDTILDVPSINGKEYFLRERIEIGETKNVVIREPWKDKILKSKDSTLTIFIFDYEKVLSSDWDSIRVNNRYRERLTFSLEKLEQLDWKVEYK